MIPQFTFSATSRSILLCFSFVTIANAFLRPIPNIEALSLRRLSNDETVSSISSVDEATRILADWDKYFNPETAGNTSPETTATLRSVLPDAVRLLSQTAAQERNQDYTRGRCMLGICASSPQEGIETLKSWVTALQLPRGLLHGMDKDGVPLQLEGGVYIKYNSGGVYTFDEIRRSKLGFDALWKPGDALLEPYDGTYRGVYFQVELSDGEFRQYLVPLDIFL